MDETDKWFEEKTSQIDSLDVQLRALHSAVDTLTNQMKRISYMYWRNRKIYCCSWSW